MKPAKPSKPRKATRAEGKAQVAALQALAQFAANAEQTRWVPLEDTPSQLRRARKALDAARLRLFLEYTERLKLDPGMWYRYSIDFLPAGDGVIYLSGEVLAKAYPATPRGATE